MPLFPFDTTIPAANNDPSADQPIMLQNNISTAGIIAVDHIGFGVANGGTHKQVTLTNEPAPGLGGGNGVLYANLFNGQSWPIWENALGSTILVSGPSQALANGFVTLPGAVIMQWGSIAGAPIANGAPVGFPMVFPNAVFSVTLGPQSNSTNDKTISISTGSLTTAGFTVKCSGTSSFQALYWIAIGN